MTTSANGINQFAYDGLYRLTSWTPSSGQVSQWFYDAVGNRTKMVSSAGTTNYSYDAADELLFAGTSSFAYDGNGNQITKTAGGSTVNYGWDTLNRLTSVIGGSIDTVYAYDGDGNRVSQQIPTGTYTYVNDTNSSLPTVMNENGPDGTLDYLNGLSMISATSAGFQYYHQQDGIGSTSNLTDATGAQKANYSYDPWGKLTTPLDPVGSKDKYKFAGEASDSNSSLYYLRARFYDPSIGRFIRRDPLARSLHGRYSYANNSPENLVDPSGRSAEPEGMVLGAYIGPESISATTPESLLALQDLAGLPAPSTSSNYSGNLPETIDKTYTLLSQSQTISITCGAAARANPVLGASCFSAYVGFSIPRAINSALPQFGNALSAAWLFLRLPTGY